MACLDFRQSLNLGNRPYRKAWSRDEAPEHIKNERGKHYDRQVVEVFLKEISNQI